VIAATVGAILLATVTLYAILGGADFGGGLWDLLAGGDRRGREPRTLIDESITPVWEANHVWLVFALVIFWTAFPDAFAAVMTVAWLPIWLAVAGIVLRGAVFAFSSLLTPFFMGAVIGGIADGQIPDGHTQASLAAWTQPTSVLTGFLFVGACGYLAAVYLIGEAARRDDHRMQTYFTRRAQLAAVLTGALSLGTLAELHSTDPTLYTRLTGRALPLVILAGVCGVAVLALLTAGRPRGVRVLAALGVAAVVWGWGVAQYPVLLPGTGVTLSNAGAPEATLTAIVVLFVALVVLIGPSFVLLFALQGRQLLEASGEAPVLATAQPGSRPGVRARDRSTGRAITLGLVVAGALARALARRRRS
jgi:cytochrome d ubiquinol oxidase subunit II